MASTEKSNVVISGNNATLSLLFRFVSWLTGLVLEEGGCVTPKCPALVGFPLKDASLAS